MPGLGTYAGGPASFPVHATRPWRALKRSRDRAASELFAALYPRLAGWCRRLVDDDETAHEVASEAFTRLWARWTTVEEPRGFLYVTAAMAALHDFNDHPDTTFAVVSAQLRRLPVTVRKRSASAPKSAIALTAP